MRVGLRRQSNFLLITQRRPRVVAESARECHRESVSPSRGGEADKFGNRYEGRWTVPALLRILVGHANSIVIEQRGEGGKGVEFVLTQAGGAVEAHQVKRQRGNHNNWTLRNLRDEDVLKA